MKARNHAKRIRDLAACNIENANLADFAKQAAEDAECNEDSAVLFSAAVVCFEAGARDEALACVNATLNVVEKRGPNKKSE